MFLLEIQISGVQEGGYGLPVCGLGFGSQPFGEMEWDLR